MPRVSEAFRHHSAHEFRLYLVRFLRARLRNESDAEDLAQEVYLRLLRVDGKDDIRNYRAYALQIATNVAYEWNQRACNRYMHSSDALEGLQDRYEALRTARVGQEMELLEQALATLSPKCRAVVILHRRDNLTYKEIAKKMGISVSMVKKYLTKGLSVCQEQIISGLANPRK